MKKLKFKYVFDRNYNPAYTDGVHGSITPNNMIVMNFFNERAPLPTSMTYELDERGMLIDDTCVITPAVEEGTFDVIRFIESGITLNLDAATKIRDWLTDQIAIAEKNQNG